jgi:DNA polymerase III subunit beta
MKISTSKTELQSALQKLSKAVPNRSTLPILSFALFQVDDENTIIRSTDLEITIVTKLPATIKETGSAAIPLQPLLEITNEINDDRITLSVNQQNKIELKTDNGVYDLMGKAPEEFPALPQTDGKKNLGINLETMKSVIERTSFAVSRDEMKPALTGVFLRVNENKLTAVATDGHRLVQYIVKDYKSGEFTGDIIIPRKFLGLFNTFTAEAVEILASDNHLIASFGDDTVYTRVIDERFPDYESVIPTDNDKVLAINRNDLLGAVRRVSIFSNKATHQIALHLDEKKVSMTTEDPEKASRGQEDLSGAQYNGESLLIGYNASYLRDIITHVQDENIIVKLKTPISATLFYPEKTDENIDLTMLLMPIRLND